MLKRGVKDGWTDMENKLWIMEELNCPTRDSDREERKGEWIGVNNYKKTREDKVIKETGGIKT